VLSRRKGENDARQMIVSLSRKGKLLRKKLSGVPFSVGNAVLCDSVTPESTPELFRMLDGIILNLSSR
jgi:hypothetical protein